MSWDRFRLAHEVSKDFNLVNGAEQERASDSDIPSALEAVWGSDPLESQGGFRAFQYDPKATFPSALSEGGLCRWTTVLANESVAANGFASATLDFGYPEINWSLLRSIYGWSALQYQAWARGNLTVASTVPTTTTVYTDGILEFRVDGELYYGGDFYSYRRAPLILDLEPGVHTVDIRLFYDIRARGGSNNPHISSVFEFHEVPQQLIIDPASILTADVVEGKLASPCASVTLRNSMKDDATVVWIKPVDENASVCTR